MKKLLFLFVLFCSLALAGQALAIPTLSLRPGVSVWNTQSMIGVVPGGIARVPLIIKELDPNSELPLIGAFDLEITYDANILAFDSVAFYDPLGDPDLDQGVLSTSLETDIFVDDSPGVLRLQELSWLFDSELDALQDGTANLLATIDFFVNNWGCTDLNLENVVLSDASGIVFDATPEGVRVCGVPEPATIFLLGSGLIGGVLIRRKRSK
jgi:hypothetical protein